MLRSIKFLVFLVFLIGFFSFQAISQECEKYVINNYCIGNVCIGDTYNTIKSKYNDCIIKVNDSNTGYYIFDSLGTFLVEFSTKKSLDNKNAPVRYIMTSNPDYIFHPGKIKLETRISDLMSKYGTPTYQSGPDGYAVKFSAPEWPIKESIIYNNFKVNVIVGVYNPKLEDLFKYSGTMNESAEKKLLIAHPETTYLNTIEIYSDYYKSGKPIP